VFQDYRELKSLDLDELIRQVRIGRLPQVSGGPINELRRWRAYFIDRAHETVRKAGEEGRALSADEDRAVSRAMDDARELGSFIEERQAESRKALSGPLVAFTHPNVERGV